MAIGVISGRTPTNGTAPSSAGFSVTLPASTTVGDYLIVAVANAGTTGPSPPSGWSVAGPYSAGTGQSVTLFHAPYDATLTLAFTNAASVAAWTVNSYFETNRTLKLDGAPVAAHNTTNNSTMTTGAPVTGAVWGDYEVLAYGWTSSATMTAASGMTRDGGGANGTAVSVALGHNNTASLGTGVTCTAFAPTLSASNTRKTGVGILLGYKTLSGSAAGKATVGPADGAMALVNSVSWWPPSGTNGGTSSGIDTTGATLLVVAESFDHGGPYAITDSKGNSYTQLAFIDGTSFGNGRGIGLYYAANPTVGTGHTFTVAGTSNFPAIHAMVFSGAAVSSPAGGTQATIANPSSGTTQAGSVTPSENNCVVVAVQGGQDQQSTADTINGGFTTPLASANTSGHQALYMSYLVQTTAAAANPTWTLAQAESNWGINGWFKPGGGGTVISITRGLTGTAGGASTAAGVVDKVPPPGPRNLTGRATGRATAAAALSGGTPTSLWNNIQGAIPNPSTDPDNYGYNSICVDAFTSGTVYVGTNKQGIWKSTNYGTTWALCSTGTGSTELASGGNWSMAVDTYTGAIYTTVGHAAQGVWKSTDGGVNWVDKFPYTNAAALAIGHNDVYTISADPHLADHLLCTFHGPWNTPSSGSPSGVIESLNGGTTWALKYPSAAMAGVGAGNGVWFGNDSATWIFGSQNDSYWITRNSGSTWTRITTDPMGHGATHSLYRDPITGRLVFGTVNGTVYRSTDSGTTWQLISGAELSQALEAIACDGVNMYTCAAGPVGPGPNGNTGPWMTKPLLASDASPWTVFQAAPTSIQGWKNGPVQAAYDKPTGWLYTANWSGGVWRLQGVPTTVPRDLTGAAAGSATGAATLTRGRGLVGAAQGLATVGATLGRTRGLLGAAVGQATVAANLVRTAALTGAAAGRTTVTVTLLRTAALVGTAVGRTTVFAFVDKIGGVTYRNLFGAAAGRAAGSSQVNRRRALVATATGRASTFGIVDKLGSGFKNLFGTTTGRAATSGHVSGASVALPFVQWSGTQFVLTAGQQVTWEDAVFKEVDS